jgi:hypothetical protein
MDGSLGGAASQCRTEGHANTCADGDPEGVAGHGEDGSADPGAEGDADAGPARLALAATFRVVVSL